MERSTRKYRNPNLSLIHILTPLYDEELGRYRYGFVGGEVEKGNVFKNLLYSGYAVSYTHLDLFELGSLTFERPDTKTFRGLALAYDAMRKGGSQPTVFNAANERAVAMFLDRRISYPQITEIIEDCMEMCIRDSSS